MNTINEMWLNSVARHGDFAAVANRSSRAIERRDGRIDEQLQFDPVSFRKLGDLVSTFGHGLIELGLQEKEGVALVAENSMRWLISDLAVLANRAFDVPRGCSSTDKELLYILGHSKVRFAILDNGEQLARVRGLQPELPGLETLIVLDDTFEKPDSLANCNIYPFDEVLALGDRLLQKQEHANETLLAERCRATTESDIATLMYTSGTTGKPKGTPLTHGNIMHNVSVLPSILRMEKGRILSVLPIWHVFERIVEYVCLKAGITIHYSTPLSMIKDLAVVKPGFLAGVPRLWMAIYNNIMSNIRNEGREKLFRKIYAHSQQVIAARRYRNNRQYLIGEQNPNPVKASLRDKLYFLLGEVMVYRNIRKRFGHGFLAGISGGGALPGYVDDFFEIVGITILEGYGLTETSPVLTVRTFDHRIPYTCGIPLPRTEIQIRNDQGTVVTDGQKGIVWVRGPQVMSGYYLDPEESSKVLEHKNGHRPWFNTGDLGVLTDQGDLAIIGRAKDTIVLNNGENIEPGPIEKALVFSPYIEQVMVCGQDQEFLTALVVPEKKILEDLCVSKGIDMDGDEIASYIQNPEIKSFYGFIINATISPETGFKDVERIVDFSFTTPFSIEDDTLTQTLKIKRHRVFDRDESLIRSMYPLYTEKRPKSEK